MLTLIQTPKQLADLENQQRILGVKCQEIRLDALASIELDKLHTITQRFDQPYIFTLRPKRFGGYFNGLESDRLAMLKQLAALTPSYLDIEHDVAIAVVEDIKNKYPQVKIIRSYHNFNNTPADLASIFASINHPTVDIIKLVTFANTSLDGLRLLNFLKNHKHDKNLIAHCMGEQGKFTRVLGYVLGNYFTYTAKNTHALPGVITLDALNTIYKIKRLTDKTRFYAVIGDPVDKSPGPAFHNRAFAQEKNDAVYVAITVKKKELNEFFVLIKTLPFVGLSVTMPLKKRVMPFITKACKLVQQLGVTNTLAIVNHHIYATNTDGSGACGALLPYVQLNHKRCLVIGAGGAARAIVYAISAQQPHLLTVINRTLQNAEQLTTLGATKADDFNFFTKPPHERYDVIINTLPPKVLDPWVDKLLAHVNLTKAFYMSINYGDRIKLPAYIVQIDALAMFNAQANNQQTYWRRQLDTQVTSSD